MVAHKSILVTREIDITDRYLPGGDVKTTILEGLGLPADLLQRGCIHQAILHSDFLSTLTIEARKVICVVTEQPRNAPLQSEYSVTVVRRHGTHTLNAVKAHM